MSIRCVSWALSVKTGSPSTKLVLIKLADNANDQGRCWPSVAHICDHTELSERAVRSQIRVLESLGLLTIEKRFVEGVQIPNTYVLNIRENVGVGQEVQGGGAGDAPGGGAPRAPQVNRQSSKPSVKPKSAEALLTPKRKSRSSLPDDFPGLEGRAWANQHWLRIGRVDLASTIEDQIARFRDHHAAKATLSADWAASWRTWAQNAVRFNEGSHNGRSIRKQTAHDRFLAGALSLIQDLDGETRPGEGQDAHSAAFTARDPLLSS